MRKISKEDYTQEEIDRLLKRIPFFNEVFERSDIQYSSLIALSEIVEIDPGEVVIKKGDTDTSLYFLLRGQLAVFLDDDPDAVSVNYISPGEVFGILSMITNTPRSAFIKADENAKNTLLYKLNFAYLTDESPTSEIHLLTKIQFYRMAVHNVRWTLEMNKMQNPKHPLVSVMMKLPFINPPKDTMEELTALKEQAKSLSELLYLWNEYDGGNPDALAKVSDMIN